MQTEQDQREESGLINESLAFMANFGCRHPWIVLIGTFLTCAASLITSFCLLKFHTQRNDLISPTKDYYQRWQQYVAEFGDDDDMVVVVEGKDRQRMELALEDLAEQVTKQPEHFDRLFYKLDLRSLGNRQMLCLPSEPGSPHANELGSIRQVQDYVGELVPLLALGGVDYRYWKLLSMQHYMDEAKKRVSKIKMIGGDAADNRFLVQWAAICQGAGKYLDDPSSYRNPWISPLPRHKNEEMFEKPSYFFSGDGTLATLMVRPMKELDGFTFAQKSIDNLRAILAETQSRYPDLKLGLTGLPVLENDEMIASQNDSNLASWLALIGVAVLYLVVYRGFRYPLMTVVTLLVGTAWAMGWMTLTVGHLNILSSAFAVMLIGMGDYGVLWVTRFGQERQHGATLPEAIARTAVSVGPGILTAALTTALAFFATMLADLKAVAELGWIAGCGVLFCALSCFIVMPALLTLFDGRFKRKPAGGDDPTILSLSEAKQANRQWLPGITHRPRLIIPICLGLTLVLAYYVKDLTYDHNLLHMQARNLDSVKWEEKLIAKNTGTSWHALSYTTTPEEALAMKEHFEDLPEVSQVRCVAELVPLDQERKLKQFAEIQKTLAVLPERGKFIPRDLVDVRSLVSNARLLHATLANLDRPGETATREGVAQAQEGLEFLIAKIEMAVAEAKLAEASSSTAKAGPTAEGITPAEDTFNEASSEFNEGEARAATLEEAGQAKNSDGPTDAHAKGSDWPVRNSLREFEELLTGSLISDLHRLRDVSHAVPITVADLPQSLRERFIGKNGKWLLRVFAKEDLWEFENLEKFVAAVKKLDSDATGKPFSTLEGLRAMKNGFFWAGIYAFIAMVIVLLLDFGNVKHTVIALAPLLLGLVATLGLMVLCGIALNPANMIAFPLVLGVGADNGVHVLHDYRTRPRGKRYSLSFATGWGIMVAALTTILGFCTLMISQHRGLYSLGLVLTLGVTCCMLTALVFLPALLRLVSQRGKKGHVETAPLAERRTA